MSVLRWVFFLASVASLGAIVTRGLTGGGWAYDGLWLMGVLFGLLWVGSLLVGSVASPAESARYSAIDEELDAKERAA